MQVCDFECVCVCVCLTLCTLCWTPPVTTYCHHHHALSQGTHTKKLNSASDMSALFGTEASAMSGRGADSPQQQHHMQQQQRRPRSRL